jgi:tetratricopeptide (TPR) repeat protein
MRPARLTWVLVPLLLAGCGRGLRDDLYRAERALWKANRLRASLEEQSAEAREAIQRELVSRYRAIVEATEGVIPPPGQEPADPILRRLLQIRATAQVEAARWLAATGSTEEAAALLAAASCAYRWSPSITAEIFRNRLLLLQRRGDPEAYAEALEEMTRCLDLAALGRRIPVPLLQAFRKGALLFLVRGDEDRAALARRAARQQLQRLLEAGVGPPALIAIHTELALLELDEGNPEAAREAYVAALEAARGTPWEPSLLFALANLSVGSLGRPEEGAGWAERLAREHPGSPLSPRALLVAATAQRVRGALDEASRLLALADSLAQRDRDLRAAIVYEMALVERDRGDWDRALSLLRQVQADAPRSRPGLQVPLEIAAHYLASGQENLARSVLQRALEATEAMLRETSDLGVLQRVLEVRSRTLVLLEDWRGAVEALVELARRVPRSELAPLALAEAARLSQEKLQETERARQLWRDLVERYPGNPLAVEASRHLGEGEAP